MSPSKRASNKLYNTAHTSNPDLFTATTCTAKNFSSIEKAYDQCVPLSIDGTPFTGKVKEDMLNINCTKKYTSRYWITELAAQAFGVDIFPDPPTVLHYMPKYNIGLFAI